MSVFEKAVTAIISGDETKLQGLLSTNPDLIQARSEREHQATLLHYIAANGVEDEHQQSPPNAVAIARMLLEAGAEPDALATIYDNETATLPLLVSSVHPAWSGVQADLVRLLCDYGANPNGVEDKGLPLATAITFRYMAAAKALVEKGARVDNPVFAAALGEIELLRSLLADDLKPYHDPSGNSITDREEILNTALVAACIANEQAAVTYLVEQQGVSVNAQAMAEQTTGLHEAARKNFVELATLLLSFGARVDQGDRDDMTPLHWAAWYGHLDMMDLLIQHGAPTEALNCYGGTVLDGAIYGFCNSPLPPTTAIQVVERLIAAGADVGAVNPYPTGDAAIDAVLEPHRAV